VISATFRLFIQRATVQNESSVSMSRIYNEGGVPVLKSRVESSSSGIADGNLVTFAGQATAEQASASTKLLCEFLTNPFGDAQQAREFLSQIEGRSVSDAELDRGEFCFQIAFYFLACLAITAHIDDPLVQKGCINRLYDRVRGYYGHTGSTAKFSDLIVAAAERDQFIAGLRELSEKTGEGHDDPARMSMTKLGLFDLVGLRRLCEYHRVMGPPNFQLTFYLVSEHLLLHYGGKKYHPAVVAVIADLLSANYNVLSRLVVSSLRATEAPSGEHVAAPPAAPESCFESIPLVPGMPDIAGKPPSRTYSAGQYVLLLVEDVGPIGAGGPIRFKYILAVCDQRNRRPLCFVTLENSSSISNVLCVFEPNGSHSNYGTLQGHNVMQEFIAKGIDLIRDRFDLGEVEELSPRRRRSRPTATRPQQPWWKLLPIATRERGRRPDATGSNQPAAPMTPATLQRIPADGDILAGSSHIWDGIQADPPVKKKLTSVH
jgi:hypothetical protein